MTGRNLHKKMLLHHVRMSFEIDDLGGLDEVLMFPQLILQGEGDLIWFKLMFGPQVGDGRARRMVRQSRYCCGF